MLVWVLEFQVMGFPEEYLVLHRTTSSSVLGMEMEMVLRMAMVVILEMEMEME